LGADGAMWQTERHGEGGKTMREREREIERERESTIKKSTA